MSAFGEDVKIGISPFAKLEAISAVYFPRFIKRLKRSRRRRRTTKLGWEEQEIGEQAARTPRQ
jgi:hypothetical protein